MGLGSSYLWFLGCRVDVFLKPWTRLRKSHGYNANRWWCFNMFFFLESEKERKQMKDVFFSDNFFFEFGWSKTLIGASCFFLIHASESVFASIKTYLVEIQELLSGQTPFYDEGIAEPMVSWDFGGPAFLQEKNAGWSRCIWAVQSLQFWLICEIIPRLIWVFFWWLQILAIFTQKCVENPWR